MKAGLDLVNFLIILILLNMYFRGVYKDFEMISLECLKLLNVHMVDILFFLLSTCHVVYMVHLTGKCEMNTPVSFKFIIK